MAVIDWYKSEVMNIIDQIGRDAFMEYMMDDPVFTGKTHNNVLQVVTDTSLYNKKEELSSDRISKIVKKADTLGWVCSQEVLDIVAKI